MKQQLKKTGAAHGAKILIENSGHVQDLEILRIRLQFAWNWFEFHAKQRMSLFNFFLIITGILANAYAIAINYHNNLLALAVCATGFVQSIGFIVFDIRSRQLTTYSEDIMEKLEREVIFPDGFSHPLLHNGQTLGLLRRDSDNRMREGQRGGFQFLLRRVKKMKTWIRLVQLLVGVIFFIGFIYHLILF